MELGRYARGGIALKRIKSLVGLFTVVVALLVASNAFAAGSSKLNGWISDSMCGAKHHGEQGAAACVRACIKMGDKPVFVDEEKKEVWAIDNPDSVKDYYGGHVAIVATADAAKKSVHIDTVTVLK